MSFCNTRPVGRRLPASVESSPTGSSSTRCRIATCPCSRRQKERATMFPGIDGFHWTVGHVIFLSLFFAVVATILATLVFAVLRTKRDFRTDQAIELCWKSDFAELPESDRRCRHELAGR